ncbi:phage portal protein, lambda family [Cohaesibacter marisflavi]|uniref:Phage portal protein, lambda family n=1 Tax=Cohaesibacter marisflavi TaxID=655353 RepID=A0A1I5C211_9HYPH|nr:phage portal protein [Cohaesibacter marisflavi]SFN80957.1 phage portal protein, lambda family [Cohaesibacter marisflavi]
MSRQAKKSVAQSAGDWLYRMFGGKIEAAGYGPRWQGVSSISNLSEAAHAGSRTIQSRTIGGVVNNPWLAKAVESLVSNLIGSGIVTRSKCETDSIREQLQNELERWLETCDIEERHDFYGLQTQITRELVIKGEAFVQLIQQGTKLSLKTIPADMVDASLNRELGENRYITAGIEFDEYGQRIAYHVLPRRRGTSILQNLGHVRIPAEDMLHVFVSIEPGQVRGLSWFTSVLLRAQTLDSYEDAQLKRQQVAALFAGFIRDVDGTSNPLEGEQKDGIFESGIEPGAVHFLPAGSDIEFPNMPDVSDFPSFIQWQLRAMAAGLGLTYEQLTGDYSNSTYSSSRAALLEFRRRIESIQHTVLVKQCLQPIYERLVALWALEGTIDLSAYSAEPEAFHKAEYLPPAWPWVDPESDAKAAILEIENGLTSRSRVVAQRGFSVEEIDAERKRDSERERGLTNPLSAGTNPAPKTEDAA